MSADDRDYDPEDLDDDNPPPPGDADAIDAASAARPEGEKGTRGFGWRRVRDGMTAKNGCILLIGLTIAQAAFAFIMIYLRSESKPTPVTRSAAVRDLAVDMLGYEVKIGDIEQLLPMRGGKSAMIWMDMVLVLGQLPEERVEGSPRPNAEEFAMFVDTITLMEPAIRSRVNTLLHRIPEDDLGSGETREALKQDVRDYVNDTLERLDFGKKLRKGIGKRRVTEVLLPSFIREIG